MYIYNFVTYFFFFNCKISKRKNIPKRMGVRKEKAKLTAKSVVTDRFNDEVEGDQHVIQPYNEGLDDFSPPSPLSSPLKQVPYIFT